MNRHILFLMPGDLAAAFEPWRILDPSDQALLIVPDDGKCPDAPIPVHAVSDYFHGADLEEFAFDVHARQPFTHVVEFSEWDVERAAALREHLGIPGCGRAAAGTGRDKAAMKTAWQSSGLPTAAFAVLHEASDLRAFTRVHGYPVVVKPRSAAGSSGVAVLRSDAERRAWLALNWSKHLLEPTTPDWIVEEYIDGQVVQVDALITERGIEYLWPSRVSDLLAWQSSAAPLTITTCALDDPVLGPARDLVRAAIEAMPARPATALVHAELFELRSDASLLLSEIAWRVGGMHTAQMLEAAFGLHPVDRYLTALLTPEAPVTPVPAVPVRMAGQVGVPRRQGLIQAVHPIPPETLAPANLHTLEFTVAPGQRSGHAAYSTDLAAKAVVTGSSVPVVEAAQRLFAEYVTDHAIIYARPVTPVATTGCVR